MSVATPFNSLGAGNGFPFCFRKVDVSAMAYWVSLGGNQKGGAVIEANFGFEEAMQLFWNLETLTFKLWVDLEANLSSGTWTYPPRDRVCADGNYLTAGSGFNILSYEQPYGDFPVVKMYDGNTADENDFVGYGISFRDNFVVSSIEGGAVYAQAGEYALTELALNSFISTSQEASSADGQDDYTDLDGFHFVCSVRGPASGSNVLDAAGCSIEHTIGGQPSEYSIIDLKGHVTGIFFNFHTYP